MEEIPDLKIPVQVDLRERDSGLYQYLSCSSELEVSEDKLEIGDVIIGDLGIERKTLEDFHRSLHDGRLFRQIRGLKATYRKRLLLLEGTPSKGNVDFNLPFVRQALVTIAVRWQIPILRTTDIGDTARTVLQVARHHAKGKVKPTQIENGLSGSTLLVASPQVDALARLPGIGPLKASRLLEHFGSLKAVVNASTKEMMKVSGIDPIVAARLHSLFNSPYKCPSEICTQQLEI